MKCLLIRKSTSYLYGKSLLKQDLKYLKFQMKNNNNPIRKEGMILLAGFDNLSGCGQRICETIISEIFQNNLEARSLLACYDIFIFPSINPDCEILGNSYRNASGTDIRNSNITSVVLQSELVYFYKALNYINATQKIIHIMEFGSHFFK